MLIEVFTNGRVVIDGQDMGPSCRAERVLLDYLVDPQRLKPYKKNTA